MAAPTQTHVSICDKLVSSIAKQFRPQFANHVSRELAIIDYLSNQQVQPDVSVWRYYECVNYESELTEPLIVFEVVHTPDNVKDSTNAINKAFSFAPSLREAFMFHYEENKWTRFRKVNGKVLPDHEDTWSEVLQCDVKTLLDGFREDGTCIDAGSLQTGGKAAEAIGQLNFYLARNLSKFEEGSQLVTMNSEIDDKVKGCAPVSVGVTLWGDARQKGEELKLSDPLLVIDIVHATIETPDAYFSVIKAMEYSGSIGEGFIYNYANDTWTRFSRNAESRKIDEEKTDWCRLISKHLDTLMRRR